MLSLLGFGHCKATKRGLVADRLQNGQTPRRIFELIYEVYKDTSHIEYEFKAFSNFRNNFIGNFNNLTDARNLSLNLTG